MVNQGYKQTEIGLIPEDWEVKELEELSLTKGLIRGPFGGALKKEVFVPKGFKVYEQKNAIYKSVKLGNYFIPKDKFDELKRFEVKTDDFILSCSGTIGRIYRLPKNLKPGIINQALLIIRLNEDVINLSYFEHIFNDDKIQNKIIDDTQGGAMKNLVGMSEFKKTLFPLPPLPEQEAIAEALSDADAWIASLEQLIAKKRLIKQGAMQELLTPPSTSSGNADGEALEPWEVKKLGEMVSLITKGTTPTSVGFDFTESGINFIKVESITKNGQIEKDKMAFISDRCNDVLNRSQIKENDILFSIAGALGRVAIVKKEIVPANTNQALGIIRLKENSISKEFLYYFFNTSEFQQMLNTISVTGAQPNLSLQNLNEFDISFPSLSEQTRIATILSDMDAELETLEQQLDKAQQIKQGMMQELLTGRIRLV